MITINTPEHTMIALSNMLGCKIGTLPLQYMGLPLCLMKPKVIDYFPLMRIIETKLQGRSTLLSYGRKLTLLTSVFSSMPIFFMSTLRLPKSVINQINKYLRNFFLEKIWI